MAYDSFEIKYLFELYPDIDFTEEFVTCQEVIETYREPDSVSTPNKWTWCRDSITTNRLIQTYYKRHYEVKLIIGRNLDLSRLQVAETTLTTRDGDEFIIYDVTTNYTKIPGRLGYQLELSFYRYDDDIINHMSSDNVKNWIDASPFTNIATELDFSVVKPSFAVSGEVLTIPGGTFPYKLRIPYTSELSGLSTSDYLYCHGIDSIDYIIVYSITSTYVIFELANYTGSAITNVSCVIDQVAGELTEQTLVESNPITVNYTIYTFLTPKYDFEITETEGSKLNEITENQKNKF